MFRRSYAIFVESLRVLAKDKEILIFPVLSGIITIIAFVTIVFAGHSSGLLREFQAGNRVLGYVVLFVWYFVSWFIVLFFNVAVIACASIRLRGGDPTIADGFRASMQHLGRIAVWALISATVGVILRVIAERAKLIGRIISGLLGAAWSIATYFIVPVMIFEGRSIGDSVKQSTQLVAKTWGESLIAAGGIGAFIMLLAVGGLALPIAAIFISPTAALVALGVMVVYWIALSVVSAALSGIFRTALYLYATEGRTPAGFTPEYVQNAFAAKAAKATNFAFGSR
ncbi:MAG: hypothetical protein DMF58_05760 [Acidobacteria bacterium]|nr:MAG: hypothetical protein DMF58_05760 [Acidobacteriota bacterium]